MQTVYICFADDTETEIGSYWAGPQNPEQTNSDGTLAFPFYAELMSDDPRYADWFANRLTILPSYITDSYVQPGA